MRRTMFAILALGVLGSPARAADACPETLLNDFKTSVRSLADATRLLGSYFSKEHGFPLFNPQEVKIDASNAGRQGVIHGYWYSNWYGTGPGGVGGYLYLDGRLVRRGYCK